MNNIQMVDLQQQTARIQSELDAAILEVIASAKFIQGPFVASFETALADYLGVNHVIGCGNGTDALQIALMALDLNPGDEVILPAFTYVATAEVVALLGLKPVMIDVEPYSFGIETEQIRNKITAKTRAIIPVHLFGQPTMNMETIMSIAHEYDLKVIEDNAQSIGAFLVSSDDSCKKTGTIGHIGTMSFYPSKNLGCFGDGGAICTNDDSLAEQIRIIANHGQKRRYYHDRIGVNSRLDAIQAAILQVKLKHLDEYIKARQNASIQYNIALQSQSLIKQPYVAGPSHVFHQYTIQVPAEHRDALKEYLASHGIPTMIYYPVPLFEQEAFKGVEINPTEFPITNKLCREVLSLPIHTELSHEQILFISNTALKFFSNL